MIRKIRQFNELFDSSEQWETEVETGTLALYSFSTEAGKYQVKFDITQLRSNEEPRKPSHQELFGDIGGKPFSVAELSFQLMGTTRGKEILNTGSQFSVFSTVHFILRHFSRRYTHIDYLYFSAKEPSRKKLYDLFARELGKKVPEWKFFQTIDSRVLNHTSYVFERK